MVLHTHILFYYQYHISACQISKQCHLKEKRQVLFSYQTEELRKQLWVGMKKHVICKSQVLQQGEINSKGLKFYTVSITKSFLAIRNLHSIDWFCATLIFDLITKSYASEDSYVTVLHVSILMQEKAFWLFLYRRAVLMMTL